jgi:ubiquinone/menaquinone biosynthesis C-methylase UbiE
MAREELTRLRAACVSHARGVVLEIGVGSGLNLPFYTVAVTRLHALDVSKELIAMAQPKAVGLRFPVEFLHQSADPLPFEPETIDTIVITWSLCSIDNPERTLREARRVLKRDGALIFVEHGLSPDAGVRKWQNRLTPVWRQLAGGCHMNRRIDDLVRGAGFVLTELHLGYVPGPRALTFMYEGRAKKH